MNLPTTDRYTAQADLMAEEASAKLAFARGLKNNRTSFQALLTLAEAAGYAILVVELSAEDRAAASLAAQAPPLEETAQILQPMTPDVLVNGLESLGYCLYENTDIRKLPVSAYLRLENFLITVRADEGHLVVDVPADLKPILYYLPSRQRDALPLPEAE